MRKTFLLVACIIGSAAFTSGQTPTRQNRVIPNSAGTQVITATSIEHGADQTVKFRGSVRIVLDNATITADEVDARLTPNGAAEYDLRGNVHVSAPARQPATVSINPQ